MKKKIIEKLRLFLVLICAVVLLKTGVSYFDDLFFKLNFYICEPILEMKVFPQLIPWEGGPSYFQRDYEKALFSFSAYLLVCLVLSAVISVRNKEKTKIFILILLVLGVLTLFWWHAGFILMNETLIYHQTHAGLPNTEINSIKFLWNLHLTNKILILILALYPLLS
jgi:hypothetical protein